MENIFKIYILCQGTQDTNVEFEQLKCNKCTIQDKDLNLNLVKSLCLSSSGHPGLQWVCAGCRERRCALRVCSSSRTDGGASRSRDQCGGET